MGRCVEPERVSAQRAPLRRALLAVRLACLTACPVPEEPVAAACTTRSVFDEQLTALHRLLRLLARRFDERLVRSAGEARVLVETRRAPDAQLTAPIVGGKEAVGASENRPVGERNSAFTSVSSHLPCSC